MNCLDIITKKWSEKVLNFAEKSAPGIAEKLGSPAPSEAECGTISNFWTEKYGFPIGCKVINATGDNPSSLAGLRLDVGDMCLSLGTSDTIMIAMTEAKPQIQGTVVQSLKLPQIYGAFWILLVTITWSILLVKC